MPPSLCSSYNPCVSESAGGEGAGQPGALHTAPVPASLSARTVLADPRGSPRSSLSLGEQSLCRSKSFGPRTSSRWPPCGCCWEQPTEPCRGAGSPCQSCSLCPVSTARKYRLKSLEESSPNEIIENLKNEKYQECEAEM